MRRRDAPDASNMLGSFSGGGEDVGHFHKVVEIFASGLCFGLETFNCTQPSGLNFKFGMSLSHNS